MRNFVRDHAEVAVEKEYYVSLVDVGTRYNVRALTTQKIGTLVRISGQVNVKQFHIFLNCTNSNFFSK